MLLELTTNQSEQEDPTVFDVQSYFNSSTSKFSCPNLLVDHEYECPFCYYKAQIILHETLLVGDANQLDY